METTSAMDTQPDFFLDHLFDTSMKVCGQAMEFRVFDTQWCGALTEDWLRGSLTDLINPTDLQWILDQGLLRRWRNKKGEEGYILYTPEQAQVLQKLIASGRYSVEELRHLMTDWDDYLEAIVMDEPPYDDFEISDFEHFKRRVQENIELFEFDQEHYRERPNYLSDDGWEHQKTIVADKLTYWRRVARIFDGKVEEQLSPKLRDGFLRQLFHLRWLDEYVRINMVQQFETAIKQGYSTEVSFDGFSNMGGEVTLSNINWGSTLRRFRETRREGKNFPLRTPAFNVTEAGIQLSSHLSPEAYAQMHEQYRLEDLFRFLDQFGSELWVAAPLAEGNATCPECDARFERTSSKRIYCDDRCRKRAKSRRWRERDPERARLCQARYWKDYSDLQ